LVVGRLVVQKTGPPNDGTSGENVGADGMAVVEVVAVAPTFVPADALPDQEVSEDPMAVAVPAVESDNVLVVVPLTWLFTATGATTTVSWW
jgi:hypothetical protein